MHGLVTTTGVRDTAEITRMRFPVWSRSVSARGTRKASPGCVNVPVRIAGVTVAPGDVIVADDDGVACVPRLAAARVAAAGQQRARREEQARDAFARGELSLDRYGLRAEVHRLGIRYVRAGRERG